MFRCGENIIFRTLRDERTSKLLVKTEDVTL